MKRLRSVVRWLGVKRLIASVVLGVVFPLLFAAWVASEPGVLRQLMTRFERSQFFKNDQSMGILDRGPAKRTYMMYLLSDANGEIDSEKLFSRASRVDLSELSLRSEPGVMSAFEYRYVFGWPGGVLDYELTATPNGEQIHDTVVSVPPGWWSLVFGDGYIPLSVNLPGLVFCWLFYTPIFYMLLSMPIALRHLLRTRRGLCTRCGYDLAGLDSCPECGKDRP